MPKRGGGWRRFFREANRKLGRWLLFGLLFAVVPFLAAYWNLSRHFHQFVWPYRVWPHGELAVICIGIAAEAISALWYDRWTVQDPRNDLGTFLLVGCVIILFFSATLFAGANALPDSADGDIRDYAHWSEFLFVLCFGVICAAKARAEE